MMFLYYLFVVMATFETRGALRAKGEDALPYIARALLAIICAGFMLVEQ
jgi:hypothetical protein